MFDEYPAAPLTRRNQRGSAVSLPYFLESHEEYDQQKIAASNTLYSLNRLRESDPLESESTHDQNDFSFHSSQTSSSFPYVYTPWDDRPTALPAPEHTGFCEFEAHGHVANPTSHYTGQGYSEINMASLPTAERLQILAPFQQQIPMSETSTMPFSSPSTPFPSIRASSRSFNSTPASSVHSEHGEMDHHIPMMEHMNKSAEGISSAPYAKLIERALLEAEGNRLLLKDIYTWIEVNTNKASNPSSNGWKNSVRHNLSMNGVSIKRVYFRSFFMLTSKGFYQNCNSIFFEQVSEGLHVDA